MIGAELVCRALATADNSVSSLLPGPTPKTERTQQLPVTFRMQLPSAELFSVCKVTYAHDTTATGYVVVSAEQLNASS